MKGGTYRKIVHKPSHVSYKLLTSTSSGQDLAQSDEDVLMGKPPLEIKEYDEEIGLSEGESLNLQVELELGSSTCEYLPPSFFVSRGRVTGTDSLSE